LPHLFNTYRLLVVGSEEKILPGRLTFRWENNIKKNLKEQRCEVKDWIYLYQNRKNRRAVLKTVMTLQSL
jgi:hypothetical protein